LTFNGRRSWEEDRSFYLFIYFSTKGRNCATVVVSVIYILDKKNNKSLDLQMLIREIGVLTGKKRGNDQKTYVDFIILIFTYVNARN
jgi:hypothetical protein